MKILLPLKSDYGTKTRAEFEGSCWMQNKITWIHGKIVSKI